MRISTLIAGLLLTGIYVQAGAACSRPIVVPVSNIGLSVIVDNDRVSGVYPDLLRELGEKAGCKFVFPAYPRARSDMMFFERGTSDIVVPASYVAERAQTATFIPLIKVLPTMVAVKPLPAGINTVQKLLEAKGLRAVVVRSFTFGKEYQELIADLEKEGRIDFVPDITTVARMLLAGRVDFTVMPPHLLHTALGDVGSETAAQNQLKSYPLEGLPRIESGMFISRRSLTESDQQELRSIFSTAARNEVFVKAHLKYYPADILKGILTRP